LSRHCNCKLDTRLFKQSDISLFPHYTSLMIEQRCCRVVPTSLYQVLFSDICTQHVDNVIQGRPLTRFLPFRLHLHAAIVLSLLTSYYELDDSEDFYDSVFALFVPTLCTICSKLMTQLVTHGIIR
jgi:hypothetical protein